MPFGCELTAVMINQSGTEDLKPTVPMVKLSSFDSGISGPRKGNKYMAKGEIGRLLYGSDNIYLVSTLIEG
jgi:hypothetical protein